MIKAMVQNVVAPALVDVKEDGPTQAYRDVVQSLLFSHIKLLGLSLESGDLVQVYQMVIAKRYDKVAVASMIEPLRALVKHLNPDYDKDFSLHERVIVLVENLLQRYVSYTLLQTENQEWTPERFSAELALHLLKSWPDLLAVLSLATHRDTLLRGMLHVVCLTSSYKLPGAPSAVQLISSFIQTLQRVSYAAAVKDVKDAPKPAGYNLEQVPTKETYAICSAIFGQTLHESLQQSIPQNRVYPLAPCYRAVLLDTSLDIMTNLQFWAQPEFKSQAMAFLHLCGTVAVRRSDWGGPVFNRIEGFISSAIEWDRAVEAEEERKRAEEEKAMEDDDDGKEKKEKKEKKKAKKTGQAAPNAPLYSDALIDKIANWIEAILALRRKADVPPVYATSYQSFLGTLSLNLLVRYGTLTPSPVQSAAEGGSVKDKEVWRAPLVKILDILCEDSNADIRLVALQTVTEKEKVID